MSRIIIELPDTQRLSDNDLTDLSYAIEHYLGSKGVGRVIVRDYETMGEFPQYTKYGSEFDVSTILSNEGREVPSLRKAHNIQIPKRSGSPQFTSGSDTGAPSISLREL